MPTCRKEKGAIQHSLLPNLISVAFEISTGKLTLVYEAKLIDSDRMY